MSLCSLLYPQCWLNEYRNGRPSSLPSEGPSPSQGRDVSMVYWAPETAPSRSSLCLKGMVGMGSEVKGWGMQI